MSKPVIVSILPCNENQKLKLQTTACNNNLDIVFKTEEDISNFPAENIDAVIGNANPAFLRKCKNLKWLQTNTAGADPYIVPDVLPKGCILTNATGAYGESVGEHTLAVTLSLIKNIHLYTANQCSKIWQDEGPVSSLRGAKVLIIGAGDIGIYYAQLVKSLGAYTIGVKRRASKKDPAFDELFLVDHVDELLPKADIVVSILPGTNETQNFYTARRFSLMKKTAFFINMGRGSGVNQDDLYDALKNGIIAGASIDVCTPEPLPKENPLWSLKNLLITPHISGGFHLDSTMDKIIDISCKNIELFSKMKTTSSKVDLLNEVDFQTGYKK